MKKQPKNSNMSVIEQVAYYAFIVGWIVAPLVVKDVLYSRDIVLPSDLGTYGLVIWYAIPFVQMWWRDRHKPKSKKWSRGPSYTDKGQYDWPDRD